MKVCVTKPRCLLSTSKELHRAGRGGTVASGRDGIVIHETSFVVITSIARRTFACQGGLFWIGRCAR